MTETHNGKREFEWTLLIEFNGLCGAELIKPPKGEKGYEMIIHFLRDSMHRPIFAARERDVRASHDCRPDTKVLVRGETEESRGRHRLARYEDTSVPTTLSLFSTVEHAHQRVMDTEPWSLEVDTSEPIESDDEEPVPANPESIMWLPTLKEILGKNKCNPLHDFAQFRLTEGRVNPGRLYTDRRWKITADGEEKWQGFLAITLIYKLALSEQIPTMTLDLHPGMLTLGPPQEIFDKYKRGELDRYTVETTYSSLPVAHRSVPEGHSHQDPTPHFNEYNRLVDTNKDVIIEQIKDEATVEDPIHCFGAAVLP